MQEHGLESSKSVAYFEFDFATHGGAVSAITVAGSRPIPSGAVITSGVIHVKTAATSGGSATVAIHALSSEDILAATAVASLSLNALLDVVPDGAIANMIRATSNITALTFTVATAALTAGKIVVALEYFVTA